MKLCQLTALCVALALSACRTSASAPASSTRASEPVVEATPAPIAAPEPVNSTVTAASIEALLSLPSGPLVLRGRELSDEGSVMTIEDLMRQMEALTGVRFLSLIETRAALGRLGLGLDSSLSVPPDQAWHVFEVILRERDYCLKVSSTSPVAILTVGPVLPQPGRGKTFMDDPSFVASSDLPNWKRHPAFAITTFVTFDSLNVRDVANSVRQMFSDPSSSRIIPIGNTNSVAISGFGAKVAELVEMLHQVDRNERERIAREARVSPAHARQAEAELGVTKKP